MPDVTCKDLPVILDHLFFAMEVSVVFPGVFLSLVLLFPLVVPAAGAALSLSPVFHPEPALLPSSYKHTGILGLIFHCGFDP